MNMKNRPLVTFAVFAYNQEKLIREAVESAVSQTYSPLEIILSDDGSKDGTFAVMQEIAKNYRGPHRVLLRQSTVNLGLCAHVNSVFEMAHGELLVLAAGDDISVPERTEKLVDAWLSANKPSGVIHSGMFVFTGENRKNSVYSQNLLSHVKLDFEKAVCRYNIMSIINGCTAAYTRDIYSYFGPLDEIGMIEDLPLSYRALLIGSRIFVQEPLVYYRRPENESLSISKSKINTIQYAEFTAYRLLCLQQILKDYMFFCRKKSVIPNQKIIKKILKSQIKFSIHISQPSNNPIKIFIKWINYPNLNFIAYLFFITGMNKTPLYKVLRKAYRFLFLH